MALQVFTAGQTLTAAQMTTLQASTYNYPLSTISASTYTVLSSDAGKLLLFTNNATPVGVTFPASLGMAVGDTVEIVHGGTGTLTLIADAGVTLNSEGSLLTLGTRYARISVTKTASNVFLVSWMTAITEAEITAGAVTSAKLDSNLTLAGNTTGNPAAGTTSTGTSGFGYMGLPQNATTTGAYTVVAADAGKHIYSTATRTITIPSNATTAMPIGSTVVFIAGSGATVTIAITSDTMYLAGPGTTGSRTLAPFGMATAVKITATSWIISGNGLT